MSTPPSQRNGGAHLAVGSPHSQGGSKGPSPHMARRGETSPALLFSSTGSLAAASIRTVVCTSRHQEAGAGTAQARQPLRHPDAGLSTPAALHTPTERQQGELDSLAKPPATSATSSLPGPRRVGGIAVQQPHPARHSPSRQPAFQLPLWLAAPALQTGSEAASQAEYATAAAACDQRQWHVQLRLQDYNR